nr:hypothetical protein [uncultured Cohaesibacter sp.]
MSWSVGKKNMRKFIFGLSVFVPLSISSFASAAVDTPFFTGVWQLNDGKTLRPLVMSDWLIFDGKLPNTWLYVSKGSLPGQQYRFLARNVGVNGVSAALVDVVRVDDTHMSYRVSVKGNIIEQGDATRLSVPNANDSCLAVDTEMKDLLGSWVVATDKKKKVKLSETELDFAGQKQAVELRPIRTGQIGVIVSGAPYALFTDAGGDYAVLQVLPSGTTSFAGGPIGQHVNFSHEIVLRRTNGRCDAAIAGRLKLMGKVK